MSTKLPAQRPEGNSFLEIAKDAMRDLRRTEVGKFELNITICMLLLAGILTWGDGFNLDLLYAYLALWGGSFGFMGFLNWCDRRDED